MAGSDYRSLAQSYKAAATNSKYARFNIDRATVIYALPQLNMYLVHPWRNVQAPVNTSWPATALTGVSNVSHGVNRGECYSPGDTVIIMHNEPPDAQAADMPSFVCIIGTVMPEPLQVVDVAPHVNFLQLTKTIPFKAQALMSTAQECLGKTGICQDRNAGRCMDVLPGDIIENGDCGTFLLHGKHYIGMGAGAFSRMEFDNIQARLRLTFGMFEQFGLTSENVARLDGKEAFIINRQGFSLMEATGALSGNPFKPATATTPATLTKENQQGFFRHMAMEGRIVDGIWQFIKTPPKEETTYTRERKKPEAGLFSVRSDYDGMHEIRSAKGIDLIKSLYVPVVRELATEESTTTLPPDLEATDWKTAKNWKPEDWPSAAGTLQDYDTDQSLVYERLRRLKARTANWYVSSREEVYSDLGITPDQLKQKPIKTAREYELPPTVKITDPNTSKEKEYYASESGIRQLPDGSIVITDGYGSEIRMVKGNILISCPGDITTLPGRDMLNMPGRNLINNAHQDVYMQSANGVVKIKAEKSVEVLAGNGGTGRLLLESRGTEAASNSTEKFATGIVIKTEKELAMLGHNIYMGLYDKTDLTEKGLKRKQTGSIVIDAARGTYNILGADGYVLSSDTLTLACTSAGTGSAIAIKPGLLGILSPETDIGTGALVVNKAPGAVTVPSIDTNGPRTTTININSGTPDVYLAGSLFVKQNGTFLAAVGGKSFYGGSAAFGGATKEYSHNGGSAPSGFDIPPVNAIPDADAVNNAVDLMKEGAATVYSGKAIRTAHFSYPEPATWSIDDYRLYAAKWQYMQKDTGSPTWKEKPVKDSDNNATYIYPGKEYWETKAAYFLGSSSPVLLNTLPVSNALV